MASVAEAVARYLWERGVRHVVGLPGGEVLDLMEACRAQGMQFILSNHETSAAFMAAVHGHLTGVPGVAIATLGPGATNLATGLGHALLDRQPMVAFTGAFPLDIRNLGSHQVVDHRRLLSAVAKASLEITAGAAGGIVARAWEAALGPPPGPVHLDLPGEVARAEAAPPPAPVAARRPQADTMILNRLVQGLREARRPALLVGLGALRGETPSQVASLAELLGIPVLVTPKAKGVVDESRPYFLGVVGLGMAADGILQDVLSSLDFLMMVGYDPVEVVPSWLEALPPGDRLASLNDGPSPGTPGTLQVEGDVAEALSRIQAQLHSGFPRRWREEELGALRSKVLVSLEGSRPQRGLAPLEALKLIRRAVPQEAVVAVDVGSHKILASQAWICRGPGAFLVSNGLSSMGFALPAANMAQVLQPRSRVACITGDGGLLMALHELEVTRRLDLPIQVFLMDDGCLALIKEKQRRRGFPNLGMDFGPMDWLGVAEGFGLEAVRAETPEQLAGIVREPWPEGPRLIDVAVDWACYGPAL